MPKQDPTKTDIKICGIKDPAMLEFTLNEGVEMVGFVHFAKSPRHLELGQIAPLIEQCVDRAKSVVLLVNPSRPLLEQVTQISPDFIQLHGSETPQMVAGLIETGQPVLKALPVGEEKDLAEIAKFVEVGAKILLDARPPKTATRPGGLGEVFDWNILNVLERDIEFMLSGGLHPENVAAAIKSTNAIGVDVSSGVESAPGEKQRQKIQQFIANARMALAS